MTIKNNLSQNVHHYFIYYDSVGSPINMLLEDPKNPHNPKARVNPTRKQFNFSPRVIKEKIKRIFNPKARVNPKHKQMNMLSKEDREKIKKDVIQKKHEKIGNSILGVGNIVKHYGSALVVNHYGQKLMMRDAEKEDRKNRKKHTMYQENTQVTEAVMDTVKNIMGRVGKHWGTLNSKARYGMRWGRVMSKKYPIASSGLKVAAGIAGTVGTGLAAHYLTHKGKMRDPNYAAETRRLTVDRKLARGDFAPIDQQVMQAQHEPIYPSHAEHYQQPSRQETMGSPEEARPQSSVNKKKGNRPVHELHNAQIAVTKHMDPEAVNRIGMSVDQSKFNLNSRTKTNTQKEDYPLDQTINRIYEGIIGSASLASNLAVKPAKYAAYKIADTLTKPIQKATGKTLLPGKGLLGRPKVVNSSIDDIIDNIYELWGAVAKGALTVGKAAIKSPLVRSAAVNVGASVANNVINKKIDQHYEKKSNVHENVGAGALSNYELNPYRSMKDVRQYERNQFITRVSSRSKRFPRNYNAPRVQATDAPGLMRGESIIENSFKDALADVGTNLDKGISKAARATISGIGKGVKGWAHWVAKKDTGKRLLYTGAGLYGAKKLWGMRKTNRAYQEKRAQYHKHNYNDAVRNLDYANDRESFNQRRRDFYRGD